MKKTSFWYAGALACGLLLLFASCDKIEDDNYILYSGAKAQWEDGDGVSDKTQRTLIEKFTGVRCINCPTADVTINNAINTMNGTLIAVAIHDSSFAFCRPIGKSPDLRTPAGNEWSNYFGVAAGGQYPIALVGRNRSSSGWALFNPVSDVITPANEALNQPNLIAIALSAKKQNDSIQVVVNLEYLQSLSDSLALTLFIMEDSIRATQKLPNGTEDTNYIHNHVLRDAITNPWGTLVDDGRNGDDTTPVATGTKRRGNFTFAPNEAWNISHCHIVAYISRISDKRILNVAECSINP